MRISLDFCLSVTDSWGDDANASLSVDMRRGVRVPVPVLIELVVAGAKAATDVLNNRVAKAQYLLHIDGAMVLYM